MHVYINVCIYVLVGAFLIKICKKWRKYINKDLLKTVIKRNETKSTVNIYDHRSNQECGKILNTDSTKKLLMWNCLNIIACLKYKL